MRVGRCANLQKPLLFVPDLTDSMFESLPYDDGNGESTTDPNRLVVMTFNEKNTCSGITYIWRSLLSLDPQVADISSVVAPLLNEKYHDCVAARVGYFAHSLPLLCPHSSQSWRNFLGDELRS